MGRKKTRAADIRRSLSENDEELSPFASIKLVEKKDPEKKKPLVKPVPKKPSEIVQGYTPSASFADILYSYEHTGNPYAMPDKSRKARIAGKKTDFGAILDKWEGRDSSSMGKVAKPKAPEKKSSYKPTKSFADILSAYEGKPVETKPASEKKKDSPSQKPLFREESEDEKRAPEASWSIFGGNEGFVRKEEKQVVVTEREVKRISRPYKPEKSFAEILESYEHGSRKKPEILKEEKRTKPEEKKKDDVPAPDFFRKESEDEKRSPEAVWSIFGNNRIIERKKEKTEEIAGEEKHESHSSSAYINNGAFPDLLSAYEKKSEKTFDEIMKEKGDGRDQRPVITISKLRTMMPQATLDLHGETVNEAEASIRSFLDECVKSRIRKISIITGKGLHSSDGIGVLRDTAIRVLTESGLVSEMSSAPLSAGGSGALWIILKA